LQKLGAPKIVGFLMLAYGINIIITVVISLFWKISAHAMGTAGPIAALILNFEGLYWALIFLIPAVCWSRVFLKQHTTNQVVWGSVYGFIATYFIIKILLNY
jgi:membrane-associated phospholipid phosphatase